MIGPQQASSKKGDQSRDDRNRSSLAIDFPILAPKCLAALEELHVFWIETRDDCRRTQPGLRKASLDVLEVVQEELLRRSSPLDPAAAFELAAAHRNGVHALLDVMGPKLAKQEHLTLTAGRPLGVCVGTKARIPVRTDDGELGVPAYGCLAIFDDATHWTGQPENMWRRWCDECEPKLGQRPRALARQHRNLVAALRASRAAH